MSHFPSLSSVNVREGFLTVDGRRFFYRQEGQGPDLVLFHGYSANHHMWAFQRRALGERFRLLTLDAPGHGQSQHIPQPHGPERTARIARHVMDHLGVYTAHVGGLSMGGFVAQAFAGQYPTRTHSLMLFDTVGRRMHPFLRGVFRWVALQGRIFPHWRIDKLINLYRQRNQGVYQARLGVDPQEAQEVLRLLTTHSNLSAMAREAEVLVLKEDQRPVVTQLKVPLLILAGTGDWVFTESLHLLDARPFCRFVAVEGAPHGTAVAAPAVFNHAVLTFLQDVETGGHPTGLWLYPQGQQNMAPRHTTREELETFRQQSLPLLPMWQAWRWLDEKAAAALNPGLNWT